MQNPSRFQGLLYFVRKVAGQQHPGDMRFDEFDSIDRVTGDEIGPELLELALTSSPFIDGLAATDLNR